MVDIGRLAWALRGERDKEVNAQVVTIGNGDVAENQGCVICRSRNRKDRYFASLGS